MPYYFASDIHLGLTKTGKDNEMKFLLWLDFVKNDTQEIFLVGDVFDFWYEYKRVIPKCQVRVLAKLAELSARSIKIHFFTGNHDMWVREFLEEECGIFIHHKAYVCSRDSRKLLIFHGDNVGFAGRNVRFMQKIFRSDTARKLFSCLIHPDVALKFGQWWSQDNRKKRADYSYQFLREREPIVQFAREYIAVNGDTVDYFIFGHLHCPTEYTLTDRSTLFVLGGWINETHPVYGVLDNGIFKLVRFNT